MALKAVLFDLDGTLLDTAPDFIETLHQLANTYQVKAPSDEAIRQQVSNGARALVKLLFGLQEGEAGFEERRQALFDVYESVMGQHCELFNGMDELIENIVKHKLAWGIITNKPVRFAEPIVNNLALNHPPALLLCPDHVKKAKPDPEAMFKACELLECEPHEVVYIGDHLRDIDCGRNAGTKTVAVSFGYLENDDDIHRWQADFIANKTEEIWGFIQPLIDL